MGPEAKFYKYFKSKTPEIIYTRIENTSSLGTPDALCYNTNHFYFTLEFKVTSSNNVSLSAHQKSYHIKHPENSFILVKSLVSRDIKLYEGRRILQLEACGLELEACSLGLEACRLKLYSLGA
tara:strand:- start:220 stop:588 length:369 start_codon:yes stop_codon:yes gene_type:complete